mgnify:CR=1
MKVLPFVLKKINLTFRTAIISSDKLLCFNAEKNSK